MLHVDREPVNPQDRIRKVGPPPITDARKDAQTFKPFTTDNIVNNSSNSSAESLLITDIPTDAFQHIVVQLFDISPKSVYSLSLAAKCFHNDSMIKSAILVKQCRHLGIHTESGSTLHEQIIDVKLAKCIRLEASNRKYAILELEKLISKSRGDKHETFHYRLWALTRPLDVKAKSEILQPFIESISNIHGRSRSAWFERYSDILRDPKCVNRASLYESLSEALRYLNRREIRGWFPVIWQDVHSLPSEERILPLTCLSRLLFHLDDTRREVACNHLIKYVNPVDNEQSIRILCELLRFTHDASPDLLNELDKHSLQALTSVRDYKLLSELTQARATLIISLPVERRLPALIQSLDLVEVNPCLRMFSSALDQQAWHYFLFSPLLLAHRHIVQSPELYIEIKRIAKYIPTQIDDENVQKKFAAEFEDGVERPQDIIKEMIAICEKFDLLQYARDRFK